ncbi:alpha/beta hydrolase [Streptomyces sp. DSM 42041]|uniref:Alpha/beta hydrolase n=1 Tax=Streptomyces hazeniae TaxID=3075538 RepID=A0ABU2NR45_9ACTN|nr:alpha/beta hydrolase [Streptomyces sp. DSM 42041]MDT0379454.1 alpha/beta hydrolase [Streptomyces sp. DSM 42041]
MTAAVTLRYEPPAPRRTLRATSADGAVLHVEEHGPADGPAVVLAHGWTCSTAFWAPVVRSLTAGGHRVVVYDQRGHGRSAPADPSAYSTGTLADDLCAVLDTVLGPGERAVVGGHSMGAMTLMAAAGRPRLVECAAAVLLCNTGPSRLVAESRVLPLRAGRLRTFLHRRLLGTGAPLGPVTPVSRRLVKYGTMGAASTPEQVEACARLVHACPRTVRAAWSHVLDTLDVEADLARLNVPTAVVSGGADRLTPPVHGRRIADALPQCTGLTELPGRGHMTPVEDADAVAGVLAALVRDHLAPVPSGEPSARVPGPRPAAETAAETAPGTANTPAPPQQQIEEESA